MLPSCNPHYSLGMTSHLAPSTEVCPDLPPIDSPCSPAEFEEPRVIDLWDLAQSANFTEKELESFRVRKQGQSCVAFCCGLQWGQVLCSFSSSHSAFVFLS